jgi:hypothetical protein
VIPANIFNNEIVKSTRGVFQIPNGFSEDLAFKILKKGQNEFFNCFVHNSHFTEELFEIKPSSYFVQDDESIGIYHIKLNLNLIKKGYINSKFNFILPEHILQKHNENNCIIIFDLSTDNIIPEKGQTEYLDVLVDVIENTITHYQLNKKRCLLLSCFDKTKQYLNMPTLGVNTVFQFFKDINKENVLNIKDRKYKIRCFNGTHRMHRIKFLEKIIDKQGLNGNNISYCLKGDIQNQLEAIDNEIDNDKIKGLLPLSGDDAGVTDFANNSKDVRRTYHKTCVPSNYIDFITETEYYRREVYLTEKTSRAIICKTPFVLLATPYSLETLKQKGFKTFSKYWDESYDIVLNHNKRLDMVFKLFEFFNDLSKNDLETILDDTKDILEYNNQHYKWYQKEYMCLDSCKKYFEKLNFDK